MRLDLLEIFHLFLLFDMEKFCYNNKQKRVEKINRKNGLHSKRKMVKSSPLSALRDVHLDLIKTFDLKKHLLAEWRCDFSGLCFHSMLLSQKTH